MKLSNVKSSIIITHRQLQRKQFLILKRFDRHNEIIFTVRIFLSSCETGGAKPKTGGTVAPLLQRRSPTDCQNNCHQSFNQSINQSCSWWRAIFFKETNAGTDGVCNYIGVANESLQKYILRLHFMDR